MSRWIRLPLGSALVFAVLAAALVALTIGQSLPVWASGLIAVVAAALLFVPIRGRLAASQWPGGAWRDLGRRGRPGPTQCRPCLRRRGRCSAGPAAGGRSCGARCGSSGRRSA